MSQLNTRHKPKIMLRRKRRKMERTMVKNIIDYHIFSEESISDDSLVSSLSSSSDDLTTMDSTTSYLPSKTITDKEESVSRSVYTLDEDDILTDDDYCDSEHDSSVPLYENARVPVRNATAQLMDFVMESNLSKSTVTKLFRLVKNLLPASNTLPITHTQIFKVLGRVSLVQSKFYCNGCNQLCIMRNKKKTCDNQKCSLSNMPLKTCN